MFSEGHFLTWILGQNFHLSDDWWALVYEWKFCAPHRTFTLSSSFEEGGTQGKSAMSWMVRLALVVTLLREMTLCCLFFCGSCKNFENFCMRGRFLLFSTPPKDFLNRKSFSTGLLRILLKTNFLRRTLKVQLGASFLIWGSVRIWWWVLDWRYTVDQRCPEELSTRWSTGWPKTTFFSSSWRVVRTQTCCPEA